MSSTGSGTKAGVCLPSRISKTVKTSRPTALDGSHSQPSVSGPTDAGLASGADVVGLGETDIDGLDLRGLAVGQVMDFVADGDLVVGLVELVEDAKDILKPLGNSKPGSWSGFSGTR